MLAKLSLGTLGLSLGSLITIVGFYAYFNDYATLNLAGFFYGIPLLLGGLALKAAELKPVPFTQPTSPDILELREKQATQIQNQIRKDITRYRYGQDAHLDDSLERFGLNPSDEARPVLVGIREENCQGCYALILEFDSPQFPLEIWQQKQEKIEKFFGPGISVQVKNPGKNHIEVALIAQN
ncbi:DUF2854 domain-containing protein [Laspinema olomoucense]|uniref:DUF2854 domain-containing protein n=1 Tax=Laspinema olomoucense D3b TaxID=2953688 RepID=A0ABT2N956_9CYAN|nr:MULTISPECIES: DUF2854 domain-containing protein [unclassified Laspinema]MCT7975151.1 DUF2854 domain-containing protein [Laspinema sp. D3d]MCT7979224.1 DUF2854 domain-containing protein [Laspinema sp. D3b]MCT7990665.1 DUF2854 domain-containing protein [Laspinema sp. D3a]MCT7996697.1 DUF2854 domain-containing protein [Laspinema sp. D3c]